MAPEGKNHDTGGFEARAQSPACDGNDSDEDLIDLDAANTSSTPSAEERRRFNSIVDQDRQPALTLSEATTTHTTQSTESNAQSDNRPSSSHQSSGQPSQSSTFAQGPSVQGPSSQGPLSQGPSYRPGHKRSGSINGSISSISSFTGPSNPSLSRPSSGSFIGSLNPSPSRPSTTTSDPSLSRPSNGSALYDSSDHRGRSFADDLIEDSLPPRRGTVFGPAGSIEHTIWSQRYPRPLPTVQRALPALPGTLNQRLAQNPSRQTPVSPTATSTRRSSLLSDIAPGSTTEPFSDLISAGPTATVNPPASETATATGAALGQTSATTTPSLTGRYRCRPPAPEDSTPAPEASAPAPVETAPAACFRETPAEQFPLFDGAPSAAGPRPGDSATTSVSTPAADHQTALQDIFEAPTRRRRRSSAISTPDQTYTDAALDIARSRRRSSASIQSPQAHASALRQASSPRQITSPGQNSSPLRGDSLRQGNAPRLNLFLRSAASSHQDSSSRKPDIGIQEGIIRSWANALTQASSSQQGSSTKADIRLQEAILESYASTSTQAFSSQAVAPEEAPSSQPAPESSAHSAVERSAQPKDPNISDSSKSTDISNLN